MDSWVGDVRNHLGSMGKETMQLVQSLSTNIVLGWHEMAMAADNPGVEFTRIFNYNYQSALGAILAILELVDAVGKGKSMPDKYLPLLKQRAAR